MPEFLPGYELPVHWRQFLSCAATVFELPTEIQTADITVDPTYDREVQVWAKRLRQEIDGSKAGYPLQPVLSTPELEDRLLTIADSIPGLAGCRRKSLSPALCLTHDIDYLAPTLQMNLKRSVGERRLHWSPLGDHYLDSLRELLDLDAGAANRYGASTLFVPCPVPSKNILHRLQQWIIDPSYRPQDQLFARFKSLINEYNCEVGLHGSFFSLADRLLRREREVLEVALERPITAGRQHWLNLPYTDVISTIRESGMTTDSTLGWNGAVGFRGGFARVFPICTPHGALWELPLLLMDGPLFDDLRLRPDEVVDTAISMLEMVYQRQGCVALNWHDRAAHRDYQWSGAYARILDWAKDKGFRFLTVSEAIAEARGLSDLKVEMPG
jgi:hypothetical protein